MLLTGRTQQFVHAYVAQWHHLFRKPGPELATFFEHVRRRVLLDNDPPHIRQGLCMVGMAITRPVYRLYIAVKQRVTARTASLESLLMAEA